MRTRWMIFAWLAMAVASPANQALETIYIVRHADKVAKWPPDRALNAFHPLSRAGLDRADRLAETLADAPIAAVYTSATTRTLATGMPLAMAKKIPIAPDNRTVREDQLGSFFAELETKHADDVAVLIVGHSNTVPHLLIHLGAEPSCWQKLDIADHDGELLIHGYEGLWRVDLKAPGCGGIERRQVRVETADGGTGEPEPTSH